MKLLATMMVLQDISTKMVSRDEWSTTHCALFGRICMPKLISKQATMSVEGQRG